MATRVTIDSGRCEGTGLCADLVPQVFDLVAEPPVQVLCDSVPPDLADLVADAVTMCPTSAISLRET